MKDKLSCYIERLSNYNAAIETNAPMRDYTSFRIGGPADVLVTPKDEEAAVSAIAIAKELELPCAVIGNGSNLLVSDAGIEGVVVRIASEFSGITYDGNVLHVLGGTLMSVAAKDSVERGFMGLEWAAGIPGTLGGAVAMNAGAYGGEIKQTLTKVCCYVGGEVVEIIPKDEDMGYRRSCFAAPDMIVLWAEFTLLPDDGGARERMADFSKRRREKQPLSYPSAGSTFKRPEGYFAGALIEQAGLKGKRIGGAEVSELHAGFVINVGGATCRDVLDLIAYIQNEVYSHSGVQLETEVKFIGR